MKFSTIFAMPNRWTFQILPIKEFIDRWIKSSDIIVDPFCGMSARATYCNDIAAPKGIDAEDFCNMLLSASIKADAVFFDPPYSPRQIAECYRSIEKEVRQQDTQNAALYKRVRAPLAELLKPGGIALSFGWQSSGFGKEWKTEEILLIQHGGAHNDTICVAQRKP